MGLVAAGIALLVGGCALPAPPASGACGSALELPAAVAQADTLMVGEIHGTGEGPRFVGDLACALVARGKAVTVGLEMPRDLAAELHAYLASDGGPAARDRLMATPIWSRPPPRQDGRTSHAMLDLLERIRLARNAGARIDVGAFDIASTVAPSRELAATREKVLATGAEALQRPGETLLLLAGDLHAIKYADHAPFPAAGKMAALMTVRPPLAIALRYRAGEYWACLRTGCGVQQARGHYIDPAQDGRIVLERSGGYDGYAYVGPITASRPAILPR